MSATGSRAAGGAHGGAVVDAATLAALWADLVDELLAEGRDTEAAVLADLAGEWADVDTRPAQGKSELRRRLADLPLARQAHAMVAAAGVWRLAGRPELAEPLLWGALEVEPGNTDAYLGLAHIRMPGPGYYELLARLHRHLRPRTYLEIGMGDGSSMALASPPTAAIGVDPLPRLCHPLGVECRIFPQTSEAFFDRPDLAGIFSSGPADLVFIDGLHTFPAVLADLAGVESVSGPGTVVVLHDTIPFDEATQRPERVHGFYTGDVWKLLPCLAEVRPDLRWFTVPAPPSGLTVVTGLDRDRGPGRIWERFDELIERFGALRYEPSWHERVPGQDGWAGAVAAGEVVANDWAEVVARL